MGILNAIFAPFIFLYMIMYSFFRYFEVRHSCFNCDVVAQHFAGIPQKSVINRWSALHTLCAMEVSRVQRALASLHAAVRRVTPPSEHVHWPISQREDDYHYAVRS